MSFHKRLLFIYVLMLGSVFATTPDAHKCLGTMKVEAYRNLLPLEWMRFDAADIRSKAHGPNVLAMGDSVLSKYSKSLYGKLNLLYDGQLIALMKVASDKYSKEGLFNVPSKQQFFRDLNEWINIRLSAEKQSKERLRQLEDAMIHEFTYYHPTTGGQVVQPLTAELKNMLAATYTKDLSEDYPRYGLPSLFAVFYERFLSHVDSPDNIEARKNVGSMVQQFLVEKQP